MLFLSLVFTALFSLQSNAQVCGCAPGKTSYTITGFQTISSVVSSPSYVFNSCFVLAPNATLFIDVYAVFDNCNFWEGQGSVITVGNYAEFSGGQNTVGACGQDAQGIHLLPYSILQANNLVFNAGYFWLNTAVTAAQGSQVFANGNFSIYNTDLGIQCNNCSLLNLSGTYMTYPAIGILCTGRPSIAITNSIINANSYALSCIYSTSGATPFFQAWNSTFSSGTGNAYSGFATIKLQNPSSTPLSLFGNAFVKNCTINMQASRKGVELWNLNGFQVDGNDININQNVAMTGIYPAGVYLNNCPNTTSKTTILHLLVMLPTTFQEG